MNNSRFVTKLFRVQNDEDTDRINDWFDELQEEFDDVEIVGYTSTMDCVVITVEVFETNPNGLNVE